MSNPENITYIRHTGYSLQGTKGCHEAPRSLGDDHKIWLEDFRQEGRGAEWRSLKDFPEYLPDIYKKNMPDEISKAGHWGSDFFIVKDFADAVLKGVRPYIDVYEACEWTAVALLSELSVMNNGKIMDMPDFRKTRHYKDQVIRL